MPTTHFTERTRGALVAVVALVALAVGCSRNDGRTLDPPVFPLPATTAPTTTALPVDDLTETLPAPDGSSPVAQPLQLVAPWRDGAPVPVRHTCDGEDVSPALTWSGVPADAVELAITVTDLDAPEFVHWVVAGIDPDVTGISEDSVPDAALLWPNGSGGVDYSGPCPPPGEEHRYSFTLHALNQQLEPADEMAATEVVEILNLTSIDQSSVSGTYARAG